MALFGNIKKVLRVGFPFALAFVGLASCKPALQGGVSSEVAGADRQTACAGQSSCMDMTRYKSVALDNVSIVIWLDNNDFYAFPEPLDNFVAAKQGKTTGKGVRFLGGRGKAVKTIFGPSKANDPTWRMPFLPSRYGITNDSSKPAFHAFRFDYLGKTYWTDAANILRNDRNDYYYLSDFQCPSGKDGVWSIENGVMELLCPPNQLKAKSAACEGFGDSVCNGK
jgi:hypothetical protein